jgi:drug/metabolite transporter (DMT)-like permease
MVDALLPIHEPEPPGGLPRRQPPDQRPGRGYALVVLAASCFIVNAGVARGAMDAGVPADRLAGLRSVGTAAALLFIVVALRRVRALRVSLTEVPWLLLYGVVGVALLLEYLAPVLIALWAWLVQRRPVRARLWPALGLALVGLALVTKLWDAGALDLFGVVMGLTAAVCFSTYFLAGEHLVRHRDVLSVAFWGFAISGVFWSLVRPWWTFDAEALSATTEVFGDVVAPVWVLVLWVVLLGTLVPYGADTAALRYLPATIVSLIAMLEPVGAAALAWVWFGESLAAVQILGGLAVMVGIVLAQTSRPTATD